MNTLKRILKGIVIGFIVLILVYNLYNFINIKVLKNDFTTINGYSVLEVISGSMEPTIKIGDLIIIDTKDKKYKENDIVTFYDVNGSFVTHRIIEIKDNNMMITKGDNNNTIDDAISMDNIIGKYVKKVPFIGMLLTSFKKPVFLVFVLVIGILYCYFISTDDKGNLIVEEDKKKKSSKKKTTKKKVTKKKSDTKEDSGEKKASTKNKNTKKIDDKKKETSKKTSSKGTDKKNTTTKKSDAKKTTKK